MLDISRLLDINRQNCEALSTPFASGPAVSCTRTFTILPLRYAAVGVSANQRKRLPTLPDHLRHPHHAISLSHAEYAIRPLRKGFLYVMEKRQSTGRHMLHPPYRIATNGALSLSDPALPWAPLSNVQTAQDVVRGMAWAFKINELEDVQELRLFYSPDPLTETAQNQLVRRRELLPALDIAPFAGPGCPTPRPYILRHDQLELVADFAAERDRVLRQLLDAQLHSAPRLSSLAASRQMLAPIGDSPEPRGIAIVVEDAIGITQELNAWRNAGMEHLKEWLETTDPAGVDGKPGPSNERKVLVAQAFTELHREFSERKIAALVDHHKQALRAHLMGTNQAVSPVMADWWKQTQEVILDSATALRHQDLEARAQTGEFARKFEERYLPLVNAPAMHVQFGEFELESSEAQRLAETRAADHLAWLRHPQLLTALAHYDEHDISSGLCFAHQTGLCVIGLEGVPAGAKLLAQWWKADDLSPGNLALRSFVFNQRAIADVLKQTQLALNTQPQGNDHWLQLDASLKLAKALASEFSLIDNHLDMIGQGGQTNTAGALAWLAQLGRQSFQIGAPNTMDRQLYRRLSTYLIASLGEQAVNLRMTEQVLEGHAPSRGRVAAPIVKRLD